MTNPSCHIDETTDYAYTEYLQTRVKCYEISVLSGGGITNHSDFPLIQTAVFIRGGDAPPLEDET